MADTKISLESAAGALTGAELLLAVQGGANVQTTTGAVSNIIVSRARLVLTEQGSSPAAVANEVQLYAKDVGGVSTLYARSDDGTETALTPQDTSAAVWSVEQAGSAPTATTDVVKLYAVAVGGRAEPSLFLEDSVVIPMSRAPRRSVSANDSFAARDEIVWVTANTVSLTLPSPTNHDGRQYLVVKSHAGANAITLVRTGSEKINDTAASLVLTGSGDASIGEWHITTDGTNWIVSGGAIS